ncbi:HTH-type transcriptional repressor KstR2 [Candidatus Thermoflexus japonica]|uniref:HTH-type transcriptional repressor KstR2 n=1 Tax=Candidatus Thermoflexus japonica TaxID=2035417 RepID=A0A2H5Y7X4_9CHLR|nr:HTH-type transcriptional repressor KstR2 [Candidatus Thermoflexus japonica]
MARRSHGDRRKTILRAAGRLFSQRGYYGTSIRDIAAAIRLQGGSLYAHITSKEELLWEIVDEAAQAFLSSLEPIVRSGRPPAEKLRLAVAAHLRVVTERQDEAVVFNHEWKALSPRRRADILARRDAYEALFREILQEGIEAGVFRADLNVPLITRFILTALNGVAVWYRPKGPLSPEQIAEAFADWVLRGLQTCEPPETSG